MTATPIRLNISTPSEPIAPGRGFYQLDEDSLFVQIGAFSKKRRFFSYLESEGLLLDFDRCGRLIFIEVTVPRRRWQVAAGLHQPQRIEAADIRWLDFRESIVAPTLVTNDNRSILKMEFRNTTDLLNYYLTDSVILQADYEANLAAIWVTDILDDFAGKEVTGFRKSLRPSPQPSV